MFILKTRSSELSQLYLFRVIMKKKNFLETSYRDSSFWQQGLVNYWLMIKFMLTTRCSELSQCQYCFEVFVWKLTDDIIKLRNNTKSSKIYVKINIYTYKCDGKSNLHRIMIIAIPWGGNFHMKETSHSQEWYPHN